MLESQCSTLVRSEKIRCETHGVQCRKDEAPTSQHPYRMAYFCPISGQLAGYAEGLPHETGTNVGCIARPATDAV
jgi:hypothetical protein